MRKLLWIGVLWWCVLISSAQSAQVTTLDLVNLRSGAGRNFAIITQIPIDTTLPVEGRDSTNAWLFVTYNGQQGWVSARYVQLQSVALGDLPIVENTVIPPATPVVITTPATTTSTNGFTRIVVGDSDYVVTDPPVNLTNWDLSITLHWNSTANLDIAVREPRGFVLQPNSGTSPSGGALNIPNGVNNDCNDRDSAALEIANWDVNKPAPKGTYTITVTYSNVCFIEQEEKTRFWVSVKDNGPQTEFWVYYIEPNTIYEFTFVNK